LLNPGLLQNPRFDFDVPATQQVERSAPEMLLGGSIPPVSTKNTETRCFQRFFAFRNSSFQRNA